jgi:hypothetical protein
MAHSKAMLKSKGDKASPFFKQFLTGNMSDKFNEAFFVRQLLQDVKAFRRFGKHSHFDVAVCPRIFP